VFCQHLTAGALQSAQRRAIHRNLRREHIIPATKKFSLYDLLVLCDVHGANPCGLGIRVITINPYLASTAEFW